MTDLPKEWNQLDEDKQYQIEDFLCSSNWEGVVEGLSLIASTLNIFPEYKTFEYKYLIKQVEKETNFNALEIFSKIENFPDVRIAVASSCYSSYDLLDEMNRSDHNKDVRLAAKEQILLRELPEEWRNPQAPDKLIKLKEELIDINILRILSRSNNSQIKNAMAQSLYTPAEILEKLSIDEKHSVRCLVSRNKNASEEVLEALRTDRSLIIEIHGGSVEIGIREISKDEALYLSNTSCNDCESFPDGFKYNFYGAIWPELIIDDFSVMTPLGLRDLASNNKIKADLNRIRQLQESYNSGSVNLSTSTIELDDKKSFHVHMLYYKDFDWIESDTEWNFLEQDKLSVEIIDLKANENDKIESIFNLKYYGIISEGCSEAGSSYDAIISEGRLIFNA